MAVNVLYSTKARASGGRTGSAETLDGAFKVNLSTPKLGGEGGAGNNPEQLFAAGYAACFLGAMKFVASQNDKFHVPADTEVHSEVGIGPRDAGGFGLTVKLKIILPEIEQTVAEQLVHEAHQVCPYSNATRNNIDVKLSID